MREELESHLGALRAFVHLRLGRALRSREETQDLVQSVCREVLAELPARGSGRDPRSGTGFRRWIFAAAENKIRDRGRHWRRAKRDPARELDLDSTRAADEDAACQLACWITPSRQAASREELARLEKVFGELPDDYREVIVLARLRGWSHERIADRLGRTEIATRTLLSRALARLAIALEPGDQGTKATL